MGVISATIKVRNIIDPGPVIDVPAKVDTGATLLVLPQSVTDELGLPTIRRQIVKYANEERAERDVVYGAEPRDLRIYPNPRSKLPMAQIE